MPTAPPVFVNESRFVLRGSLEGWNSSAVDDMQLRRSAPWQAQKKILRGERVSE